jgi:RES domain-containing protein
MQVPSVVVPEEFNVVIDPRHADARHVKAHKLRGWDFDARMWR